MKLRLTKSALSDLEAIKHYYSEQDATQVGLNFIAEIFNHIEMLPDHPRIGRAVPEFSDELIREIIHPPFRIVYLLEEKTVHIVRVWRSERLLRLPEITT